SSWPSAEYGNAWHGRSASRPAVSSTSNATRATNWARRPCKPCPDGLVPNSPVVPSSSCSGTVTSASGPAHRAPPEARRAPAEVDLHGTSKRDNHYCPTASGRLPRPAPSGSGSASSTAMRMSHAPARPPPSACPPMAAGVVFPEIPRAPSSSAFLVSGRSTAAVRPPLSTSTRDVERVESTHRVRRVLRHSLPRRTIPTDWSVGAVILPHGLDRRQAGESLDERRARACEL